MEKEFVNYENALALKELGFDEECFAFYNGKFLDFKIQGGDICSPYLSTENRGGCLNAPLYQQAFKFCLTILGHYFIRYWDDDSGAIVDSNDDDYELSFESREDCLRILIEIAQNK